MWQRYNSIQYLQSSTALLLAIPDVPKNEGILTGKLFEYLASRKPIIGIGPATGDAAHIIHECKAGSMLDYQDEEDIYKYLASLYDSWTSKPDLRIESELYKQYSRQSLTHILSKII